ncbi:ANTAR domain-containing protein [Streptomyces sp. MB09-02B]|uniref:ANTAR domain-containing protein n=1 Tax=Streptomyces sp. MB09-02B TaxID=3028667 RepID=UPI0029A9A41F|nr:ANTAR domain-containing protein [Streptomyces sp. MB09-02B]MDX3641882.1 ANTAR domain-containing protein [Streptomyces sp. MB09-02B]
MRARPWSEPDGDDEAVREELARLRAEVRQLRTRMEGRPLIAQVQGMLRERYALPDAETAFALLQRASQQYNVKLRTLAEAAVSVPRPDPRGALWFPGRARHAEPALSYAEARDRRVGRGNRSEVLTAVLSQALAVVGTDMGNVQIADRTEGGLRIERHTGHTADFVDFFAYVGEEGTSCAKAARDVAQVTVQDVATDPVFTEDARAAILRAGSRACHSVPLTTSSGLCVGMVSAHFERPLKGLTRAQLKALTVAAAETGEWLAWYDRTVVLDALEHLHTLGRAHGGGSITRR